MFLLICILLLFILSAIAAYSTYFRHQHAAEEIVKKTDVEGETSKHLPEELDYFNSSSTSTYSPPTANGDIPNTPWSPGSWTVPSTPLSAFFKRNGGSDSLPGSPSWKPRPQPTRMMGSFDAVVDKVAGKVANMLKEEDDSGAGLPCFRDDQSWAAEKLTGVMVNGVGGNYEQMAHRRRKQTPRSHSYT